MTQNDLGQENKRKKKIDKLIARQVIGLSLREVGFVVGSLTVRPSEVG